MTAYSSLVNARGARVFKKEFGHSSALKPLGVLYILHCPNLAIYENRDIRFPHFFSPLNSCQYISLVSYLDSIHDCSKLSKTFFK